MHFFPGERFQPGFRNSLWKLARQFSKWKWNWTKVGLAHFLIPMNRGTFLYIQKITFSWKRKNCLKKNISWNWY